MTEQHTVEAVVALYTEARQAPGSSAADVGDAHDELRALIQESESTAGDRARWRAACAELADLLRSVDEELARGVVVRTRGGAATVLGWGGSARTVLAAQAPPAALSAHAAAVRETAPRRLDRLALFTTTLAAAIRIAALTTGSVWGVLPVAWRLVRCVGERDARSAS